MLVPAHQVVMETAWLLKRVLLFTVWVSVIVAWLFTVTPQSIEFPHPPTTYSEDHLF